MPIRQFEFEKDFMEGIGKDCRIGTDCVFLVLVLVFGFFFGEPNAGVRGSACSTISTIFVFWFSLLLQYLTQDGVVCAFSPALLLPPSAFVYLCNTELFARTHHFVRSEPNVRRKTRCSI